MAICIVQVAAERFPPYRTGVSGIQSAPGRPEAVKGATSFLKLWLWQLTSFERLVYVDPDVLLRRSLDGLFAMPLAGAIAASPDDGFTAARSPRQFNSGLLVLQPDLAVFESLVGAWRAQRLPSFDGGDQGFLWSFFGNTSIMSLPRRYNTLKRREYAAGGVAELNTSDALHFVGNKPWGKRGSGCRTVYPASQSIWQMHVDSCAQLECANASMHRALLGQPSLHQPLVPGRRGCIHDAAIRDHHLAGHANATLAPGTRRRSSA